MNVLLKSYNLEQRTDGSYWMNYEVVKGSITQYYPNDKAIAIRHTDPTGINDVDRHSVQLVIQNNEVEVTFVEQIGSGPIVTPLNVIDGGPTLTIQNR